MRTFTMSTAPSLLLAASRLPALSSAIILDVRDRGAYNEGHRPGAIHLDIKHWESLSLTVEGNLECMKLWASQVGALGINGSVPVIIYDDGRMTEAARAWFILQWHGVDARVLDGGWPSLCRMPNFVPEQAPQHPVPVRYVRSQAHVPMVRLIQRQELLDRLGTDVHVLDVRTLAEHLYVSSDSIRLDIVRYLARVAAATCGELDGRAPNPLSPIISRYYVKPDWCSQKTTARSTKTRYGVSTSKVDFPVCWQRYWHSKRLEAHKPYTNPKPFHAMRPRLFPSGRVAFVIHSPAMDSYRASPVEKIHRPHLACHDWDWYYKRTDLK
jgi:rhodanese-related sulfurtransferase